MLALGARGREFDSLKSPGGVVWWWWCGWCGVYARIFAQVLFYVSVAQWLEQSAVNRKVGGSNPSRDVFLLQPLLL